MHVRCCYLKRRGHSLASDSSKLRVEGEGEGGGGGGRPPSPPVTDYPLPATPPPHLLTHSLTHPSTPPNSHLTPPHPTLLTHSYMDQGKRHIPNSHTHSPHPTPPTHSYMDQGKRHIPELVVMFYTVQMMRTLSMRGLPRVRVRESGLRLR